MMSARIAMEYIAYARQLSSNGSYGKAVDLYLMAFEKNAQLKALLEPEFRSNIKQLNIVLANENKIDEMFANFSRVIQMFPDNVFLMNEMGKYLFNFGYYAEAWNQFKSALRIDAGYVSAEKNLNSMKNMLVDRWHFRMLNDKVRNDAYRAAFREMVRPRQSTVLDLGTGTGLLAMYATECSPASVIACDGSEVMTTLTDCVLEDNRLAMSILVLTKLSTSMNYTELGGRRSLLVTELFDAGLFGEHVLQTLSHAWEHLLADSAQVIPRGAEFFVLGAHSDLLSSKYQLQSNPKSLLNLPRTHVHIFSHDDTYDCDDVHQYNDIKYVTDAAKVVKVDFTDPNDIQDKLNCAEPYSVELKALENGEMNVLIGWFNLHLTTNISITTDPRVKNRANAWQQALFFDSLPRNIVENETFSISFLMNLGKITEQKDPEHHITRISPEALRFLNDTDYMKMIKSCIGMAYVYLSQMAEMSDIKIIDLCPFPVFGWFMLKRGISSLTCYAKTEYDRQFLENVFNANSDVPLSKVKILTGDDWKVDAVGEDKFHAIFCNVLELCGDLDIRCKEIADHLRSNNLIPGGLFMPSTVSLVAQIVSSNWLDVNNRVSDSNVGYKISPHINKYQVSQHFNLDLSNLEYAPMSDPIVLGDCTRLSSEVVNVTIKNDGDANAILCWYSIELMDRLEVISTKRPYSFIDGTAFLLDPIIPMVKDKIANILCCVDEDGLYKLMLDLENT